MPDNFFAQIFQYLLLEFCNYDVLQMTIFIAMTICVNNYNQ